MRTGKFLRKFALRALWAVMLSGLFSEAVLAADKIKVGALRFTSHSASFVAFERQYFQKNGLDVEFVFFRPPSPWPLPLPQVMWISA